MLSVYISFVIFAKLNNLIMLNFTLVSTKHLSSGMLFLDEDDYRAAMNIVAICSFVTGVRVIAFIMMSNHVHFVLMGSADEARFFIDKFKALYGKYFFNKYGVHEFMRRLGADLRALIIEDESLMRGIAYVHMNSVAANLTPSPFLYPWGTGATFFNPTSASGRRLQELSKRQQYRILRSRMDLPQQYVLGEAGYVLPHCYAEVEFVEKLFCSPSRYSYFLNTSSKARQRKEKDPAPSFADYVAKAVMENLVNSLFRTDKFDSLDFEKKADVLKQMHRRLNSDAKQLSRITGIRPEEIIEILDTFQ